MQLKMIMVNSIKSNESFMNLWIKLEYKGIGIIKRNTSLLDAN